VELGELAHQPAEVEEDSLQDDTSLAGAQILHRESEVSKSDSPEPAMHNVCKPENQFPYKNRTRARQKAEQFQQQPRGNELDQIAKLASFFGRHGVKLARQFMGVNFMVIN
jgi:hypothetical protein